MNEAGRARRIGQRVIAVIMLLTIAVFFVKTMQYSVLSMSFFDLVRAGFGSFGSEELMEIFEGLSQYIRPVSILIILVMALTVIGSILVFFLPKSRPFYTAVIVSVLIGILTFFVVWMTDRRLTEIGQIFYFSELGITFKLDTTYVVIWCAAYVVIIAASVVFILLPTRKMNRKKRKLYSNDENGSTMSVEPPTMPGTSFTMPESSTTGSIPGPENITDTSYSTMATNASVLSTQPEETFYGAIIGTAGLFAGKAYPLRKREQVYFVMDDGGTVYISKKHAGTGLASVYYIPEYREYCVIPDRKDCVRLESGQALGRGRDYYLPRGMKLVFTGNKNTFILA